MASKLFGNRRLFVLAVAGLALAGLLLVVTFTSDDEGASAGAPASPGFSIGINTNGNMSDDCDTKGGPTTCQLPAGMMFMVNGYLDSLGGASGFEAVANYLSYSGVGFQFMNNLNPNSMWPGCSFEANDYGATWAVTACGLGLSSPPSTYTGRVSTTVFACTADGSVTMVHGDMETLLADSSSQIQFETGPDETLTIDCVDPQAYPGDTDGDSCPDVKEQGSDPKAGGMRSFLSPWDYFNPTGDGLNRIDDMLAVQQKYFDDDDDANPGQPPYEPGYTPGTDRTGSGPNVWNLGPPDGAQRIDDMLAIKAQFFHDCS